MTLLPASRRMSSAWSDVGASTLQTMIVLIVVGVLIYVALPVWGRLVERAKVRSCQQNQRTITEAIGTARADRDVPPYVGYFDATLEAGHDWGRVLIPDYLSKAPACPVSGQLYNMSPFGRIWSDKGAGQYTWVNQGAENDHQLKSQ